MKMGRRQNGTAKPQRGIRPRLLLRGLPEQFSDRSSVVRPATGEGHAAPEPKVTTADVLEALHRATGLPIVAVPTSIGYGASFGGLAAMLGMLNSCAPQVVTVNIDNGFGAGFFAALVTRKHS